MVDHPFRTAAAATAGVYDDELLEAGVERTILVLAVDESLGDFEFDTGEIPLAVSWAATGYVYFYDSTDSTTPDDGLTTLVTGNGLRYAVEDAASISLNSVLDVVTAPAGTEVVGDAYIVDAAATDEFVGQDENIAVLTRRGWVFATPEIGHTVLNVATGQNTQFTSTGWGAFAVEFADGSIPPTALEYPGGLVVEDTLDAPPGSPTTGKLWIVGATPSGDFTGHIADIAFWTGSAWDFMDPADGWSVFHKAFGFEVFYTSGSWLGGAGSDFQEFSTAGGDTWTKPAKGNRILIECWAAGASGGKGSNDNAGGGGGGGSYSARWMNLSEVSSSVSVTVGAGGAARTTSNTDGQVGGNTSFGAYVTAYGGGAGGGAGGNGGGGGGQGSAGSTGNGGTDLAGVAGGAVGNPGGSSTFGGGGGGQGGSGAAPGGSSMFGGGGGGANGAATGDPGTSGGKSAHGGGGGGAGGRTVDGGDGGTSAYGGAGGKGAFDSGNATAGSQPGGGGGGSENGNSGKGGDGLVRVTVV